MGDAYVLSKEDLVKKDSLSPKEKLQYLMLDFNIEIQRIIIEKGREALHEKTFHYTRPEMPAGDGILWPPVEIRADFRFIDDTLEILLEEDEGEYVEISIRQSGSGGYVEISSIKHALFKGLPTVLLSVDGPNAEMFIEEILELVLKKIE